MEYINKILELKCNDLERIVSCIWKILKNDISINVKNNITFSLASFVMDIDVPEDRYNFVSSSCLYTNAFYVCATNVF